MTVFLCASNERERERERKSMRAFKPFRVWGEEATDKFPYLFFLYLFTVKETNDFSSEGINAITAMSIAHISLKKIK